MQKSNNQKFDEFKKSKEYRNFCQEIKKRVENYEEKEIVDVIKYINDDGEEITLNCYRV